MKHQKFQEILFIYFLNYKMLMILSLKDQNNKISSFIIDFPFHFYEEFNDDLWLKKLNSDSIINNITRKKKKNISRNKKKLIINHNQKKF